MNLKSKYDSEQRDGSLGKTFGELERSISKLSIPGGKAKEMVWQSILEQLAEQPEVKVIQLGRIMLRIAASILILIAVGGSIWIWEFGNVSIYSPMGQHFTVYLPDSSKVQLNADTRIAYNKTLWFISRKVVIKGEALFKVKKGKQFDVVADLATTSVLGTTFDVYAREGKVMVSCIEGKVSVKNNHSNDKVILTAGLFTHTKQNKLSTPAQSIKHDEVAWTYGDFYFNNQPLSEVLKEIERQFNVDISYDSLTNRHYTGYFNNKDLNDALRIVCIPMELSYSINGKTIEIKQNKRK